MSVDSWHFPLGGFQPIPATKETHRPGALGAVLTTVEGLFGPVDSPDNPATEWLDANFGKRVEHKEAADWATLRPRPTRALGAGTRQLSSCDPRIPEEKNKAALAAAAAEASAIAEAQAAAALAAKEKAEFAAVFARKAQVFALEDAGRARRMSYFGRPAQQSRLKKREFHASRLKWEQQAAMFQHLELDCDLEMQELKQRRNDARNRRNQAASSASHLRAREKGTALAAASLSFAAALDKDREVARSDAGRMKQEAEAQVCVLECVSVCMWYACIHGCMHARRRKWQDRLDGSKRCARSC